MSRIPVSIIVCTFNREETLRVTMRSILANKVPENFDAELLIVDNASTDDTKQAVASMQSEKIPVRYVHESRKGLSNARNRGVAEAKGDILLFTDDDLRPPKQWLEAMCAPIVEGRSDAVLGGVEMAPRLARPWMGPVHRGYLACTGPFLERHRPGNVLITPSMALSRKIFQRVPRFDSELGCGALGFHEDGLFSWQLARAGFTFECVKVVSEHHFSEERLLRSSFLAAARRMGRSSAYVAWHWNHKEVRLPRLQSLLASFKLAAYRAKHPGADGEGCAEAEIRLEQDAAFFKRYLVESRRPRNYERRGLAKRDS